MPHNAVAVEREKIHVPWIIRYLVTGQYIFSRGDNADFLHDATEDFRGRPVVKLTRARWRRVARRNAAVTIPLALLALTPTPWMRLEVVITYVALLALAALCWAAMHSVSAIRAAGINRRLVDPAARTLCAELSARYHKRRSRKLIQLPRAWRRGNSDEPVRIVLPVDRVLTDAQQRKLVRAVGGRLGIQNARGSWCTAGERMTVDISGTPLPPTEVTYEQLREAILAAPVTRPIAGMAADGPLSIDYEQDSPHVACSGTTGTGKSTLFRLLASQRMRHGNGAIFLDYKRWSHRWVHELPSERAQYWFRAHDIHEALVAIGAELHRRIEGNADDLGRYRTIDVYVEEINTLIGILNAYWAGKRREIIEVAKAAKADDMPYDPADLCPPALSPAVSALKYGCFMGRELQIHFHAMAQRLEANVFGSNTGSAVRDCFQIRFMANWDRPLWKMLASGLDYVAWPGGKRGLWGVAISGQFHVFRVPMLSKDQAIELAMSGPAVTGPILGGEVASPATRQVVASGVTLASVIDQLPGQNGPRRLSLDGLRTAVKRAGHPGMVGKAGATYLYDLEALSMWRQQALASE